MAAYDKIIDGIITLLRGHHTRHELDGGDQMSLAGLTVLAQDIDYTLNEYTSAQTLTADNYMVTINASGNTTVTLPAAASHAKRVYTILNAHSTGKVTIDANNSETINGDSTISLTLQYQYVTIICDGTQWFIIGGVYVKIEELIMEHTEVSRKALIELELIKKCLKKMSDLDLKENE